ncbi:MAG: hypothetical protein WCJ71_09035, partial [Candidatus Omnitrophota bacterium]
MKKKKIRCSQCDGILDKVIVRDTPILFCPSCNPLDRDSENIDPQRTFSKVKYSCGKCGKRLTTVSVMGKPVRMTCEHCQPQQSQGVSKAPSHG